MYNLDTQKIQTKGAEMSIGTNGLAVDTDIYGVISGLDIVKISNITSGDFKVELIENRILTFNTSQESSLNIEEVHSLREKIIRAYEIAEALRLQSREEKKVVDYQIVHLDFSELDLTQYIQDGWEPFGGVVGHTTKLGSYFIQAIVKYA